MCIKMLHLSFAITNLQNHNYFFATGPRPVIQFWSLQVCVLISQVRKFYTWLQWKWSSPTFLVAVPQSILEVQKCSCSAKKIVIVNIQLRSNISLKSCSLEVANCRKNCNCELMDMQLRSNISCTCSWYAIAEVVF